MSTEAMKHLMIQNASEINKHIKHLEEIQKNITGDMSNMSKKEMAKLMDNNFAFHEIDAEIGRLKYSLKGASHGSLRTRDEDSEEPSKPKKKVLGFKVQR